MKINGEMRPYLPYHVIVDGQHRVVYLAPRGGGHVEWRNWFTDVSYGVGTCTKYKAIE